MAHTELRQVTSKWGDFGDFGTALRVGYTLPGSNVQIHNNTFTNLNNIVTQSNTFTTNGDGVIFNNRLWGRQPNHVGINIRETSMAPWNILRNTFDNELNNPIFLPVSSIGYGVKINSGKDIAIGGNLIYAQVGIDVKGTNNSYISCNNLNTNFANLREGTGISSTMLENSTIACNEFWNYRNATTFNSVGSLTMRGNDFNSNREGTLLNEGAVIGTQYHNGNKWRNNNHDATHLDQDFNIIGLSRFWVRNDEGVEIAPNNINPASDWFRDDNNDPSFLCHQSISCGVITGAIPFRRTFGSLEKSIIAGGRLTKENPECSLWLGQKQLYSYLKVRPDEVTANGEYQAFMAAMSGSNIAKLYEVEEKLQDWNKLEIGLTTQLRADVKKTKELLEEDVTLADRLQVETDISKRQVLLARRRDISAKIHQFNIAGKALYSPIAVRRKVALTEILEQNAAIVPNNIMETNAQATNRIELETLISGAIELNPNQKNEVMSIAYQCPDKGGDAVFRARTLAGMVGDLEFDDAKICNRPDYGYARVRQQPVEDFKMYPNPALDNVTVEVKLEGEQEADFVIFNSLGRELIRRKVDVSMSKIQVDISELPDGFYHTMLIAKGKRSRAQKLVVLKY